MSSSQFFKLKLSNVDEEQEELVSLWCFDHGAEGISEVLPFRQNMDDYSVEYLDHPIRTLEAYFPDVLAPETLSGLKVQFPEIEFHLSTEQNQDWMAEWKKGFVPFHLVDGVWVVPHWCQRPHEAKQVIWMEPGMAFGTGTHETTRLAAELLAEALRSRPGARVLDVGTGTGILAILAQLLGAEVTVATDIDSEAVRVARENIELNQKNDIAVSLETIQVSDQSLSEVVGVFEIVVANIIDGVLVALQSGLKRKMAPDGALILSGIIDERYEHFKERFELGDLHLTEHKMLKEWHGWLVERTK